MKTLTFSMLLISTCLAADTDIMMGHEHTGYSSTKLIASEASSPSEALTPERVRSIFDYPDNQWTPEKIDSLDADGIIRSFEELVWQGDGNMFLYVQDMMHRNILSNNNRGFGKLVLNSEVQLKDYLKEQVAEIQDRQQADRVQQETDQ